MKNLTRKENADEIGWLMIYCVFFLFGFVCLVLFV